MQLQSVFAVWYLRWDALLVTHWSGYQRYRKQALRLVFLLGGVSLDECIVQRQRRLKEERHFKGREKIINLFIHNLFIHWWILFLPWFAKVDILCIFKIPWWFWVGFLWGQFLPNGTPVMVCELDQFTDFTADFRRWQVNIWLLSFEADLFTAS